MPELASQPALFDEADVGSELLTLERDAASGRHTGTTLARRVELRDAICERLLARVSVRQVCRIYGVGRNTVTRLVELLERTGKMEPLKGRLARKLGQIAELGTDLLQERIDSGDVPTNVIPIAVGVALDKKEMLERGSELGEVEAERGLNVEAINAWVDNLPRLSPGTQDVESSANHTKPA